MVRVLLLFLCTDKGCSGRTVVTVGDIEALHLGKLTGDGLHILSIVDNPELMTETVDGSNEIVLGLGSCIAHDERVERLVIWIGEEYRLDVGVVHTDMLHAVFLLIAARQLMLFDITLHVVVHIGADNKTILRLSIHGLGIDVIMVILVLHQPALVLKLLEVLGGLLIDTGIVLRSSDGEINFGLNDMVEALLVTAGLGTCLLTVEHVIGTALYLLHQLLWRTDSFEWFNDCHCSL